MDKEDAELLQQIGHADSVRLDAEAEVRRLFAITGAYFLTLLALTIVLAVAAYFRPDDSFSQSLLIEFSSGCAMFLAVPRVLLLAKSHRWRVLGGAIAVSFAAGWLAYVSGGVTRSLLIEVCVGALLVVALDFFIDRVLAELSAKQEEQKEKLLTANKKIGAAEEVLDAKYAWNEYLGIPRPDQMGGLPIADGELEAAIEAAAKTAMPDKTVDDGKH